MLLCIVNRNSDKRKQLITLRNEQRKTHALCKSRLEHRYVEDMKCRWTGNNCEIVQCLVTLTFVGFGTSSSQFSIPFLFILFRGFWL